MHSPSVASLKLSFSLLTSKPRLSKVHGLDLYLSFILGICTDVTCSKYEILKIMRVSAAIPRGRPPGNPRATHGLSRGFVAKACPARGALERFCVFGKIPRAIPTGFARNLLSQRSAEIAQFRYLSA